MFFKYEGRRKIFCGGKEDWGKAEEAANSCTSFEEDVDEELVADNLMSCYNCRFRRWTAASFICLKDNM